MYIAELRCNRKQRTHPATLKKRKRYETKPLNEVFVRTGLREFRTVPKHQPCGSFLLSRSHSFSNCRSGVNNVCTPALCTFWLHRPKQGTNFISIFRGVADKYFLLDVIHRIVQPRCPIPCYHKPSCATFAMQNCGSSHLPTVAAVICVNVVTRATFLA